MAARPDAVKVLQTVQVGSAESGDNLCLIGQVSRSSPLCSRTCLQGPWTLTLWPWSSSSAPMMVCSIFLPRPQAKFFDCCSCRCFRGRCFRRHS